MAEPHPALLMFVAVRHLESRVLEAAADAGFDFTLAQAQLIARIGEHGTRLTDLAEQAQITKQSAGFLVDQIERAGFVERVPTRSTPAPAWSGSPTGAVKVCGSRARWRVRCCASGAGTSGRSVSPPCRRPSTRCARSPIPTRERLRIGAGSPSPLRFFGCLGEGTRLPEFRDRQGWLTTGAPRCSSRVRGVSHSGAAAGHTRFQTSARSRREEHMAAEKITAETRTEFGKGAARRIRRADKVPAVIYGHGNDPIHVTLPGHDTMMALKHGGSNALLELDIEGKSQLALTRAGPDRPDQARTSSTSTSSPSARARRSPSTSTSTWSARPRRTRWSSPRTPASRSRPRPPTSPSTSRSASRAPRSAPRSTPPTSSSPRAARCSPTATSWSSTSPTRRPQEEIEAELEEAEAEAGIEREEHEETAEEAEAAGEAPRARPPRATSPPRAAPRSDPPPAQVVTWSILTDRSPATEAGRSP